MQVRLYGGVKCPTPEFLELHNGYGSQNRDNSDVYENLYKGKTGISYAP